MTIKYDRFIISRVSEENIDIIMLDDREIERASEFPHIMKNQAYILHIVRGQIKNLIGNLNLIIAGQEMKILDDECWEITTNNILLSDPKDSNKNLELLFNRIFNSEKIFNDVTSQEYKPDYIIEMMFGLGWSDFLDKPVYVLAGKWGNYSPKNPLKLNIVDVDENNKIHYTIVTMFRIYNPVNNSSELREQLIRITRSGNIGRIKELNNKLIRK